MLTFGFATLIDLLSWVSTTALALKVIATVILLSVGKEQRDQPGWGSVLWWVTKITPIIAIPCLMAIVLLERMTDQLWIFLAMMVFVAIAVPLKIRERRKRITAGVVG